MDVHGGDSKQEATGGAPVRQPSLWDQAVYKIETLIRIKQYEGKALLEAVYEAICERLEERWRSEIAASEKRLEDFWRRDIDNTHGNVEAQGKPSQVAASQGKERYEKPELRRLEGLWEVKQIDNDGFPAGSIDVRHLSYGAWTPYVPLSVYVDSLKQGVGEQTALQVRYADRLGEIAEEGWKIGSLSRSDVEYLRRAADRLRVDGLPTKTEKKT